MFVYVLYNQVLNSLYVKYSRITNNSLFIKLL